MIENISYAQWISWRENERGACVRALADELRTDFALVEDTGFEQLPIFEQRLTGIRFRLIPGGEFVFGLTEEQESAARAILDPPPITISELRPALRRSVKMFLMGLTPVLWPTVTSLLPDVRRPG
jgi:hypothetical protein